MNQVTQTTGNAVGSLASLKSGLANVRQAIPRSSGNPFLRMQKDGNWVYGSDDVEVHPDQVWAVNPMDIAHGWIAWKDRPEGSKEAAQVLSERMVSLVSPKPLESDLPPVSGGSWTNQIDIPLKGVGGDDADVEVNFKTNSVGGLNESAALIDAIMKQLDIDENKCVPLVKLANDSYKHKTYGKIYTPVFEIVGWTGMDVPEAGAATPAAKEAEVTRVTKAGPADGAEAEVDVDVYVEDETVAEAPTRRRRRPAA